MKVKKKIILSDENYYTNEADWQYMSVSQYKDFKKCEIAAWAKLREGWNSSSDPKALLVGNYVHSYFESKEAHEKFKLENATKIMSKRKPYRLLKDFQIAEDMIAALERQQSFNALYQGEKEHITTGTFFGAEWKAKIDCLNTEEGYFVDIKTAADLNKKNYSEHWGQRVSWIADFGYYLQMAVYRQLLYQEFGKEFTPIIAAVSKQSPPGFRLYVLDEDMMSFEISQLEEHLPRVLAVKYGQEEPIPCGNCEYCRSHVQVTEFSHTED